MRLLVVLLAWFLRAVFTSRGSLALENLALRQQLATYARTQKRCRTVVYVFVVMEITSRRIVLIARVSPG